MGEIGNVVAMAWRSMWADLRHLGLIDFKWLILIFVVSAVLTAVGRSSTLRRLERKNRLLRLLVAAQAANDELRRRGSELQIDIDDVEV